jgi:hypothetical protein
VKKTLMVVSALVMVLALVIGFASTALAAEPIVTSSNGAFVRLVGNPAEGTVKFQYGWDKDTPASAAAGYWVGVYDDSGATPFPPTCDVPPCPVHYVWAFDTGPFAAPVPELFLNAHPTPKLPPGEYHIDFFVRSTYSPADNIVTITVPFTVVK